MSSRRPRHVAIEQRGIESPARRAPKKEKSNSPALVTLSANLLVRAVAIARLACVLRRGGSGEAARLAARGPGRGVSSVGRGPRAQHVE